MNYDIHLHSNNGTVSYEDGTVSFCAEQTHTDTAFSLTLSLPDLGENAYLFAPAAVYNGNRMKRRACSYPPMYAPDEIGVSPEPVITNLPALNPDGSGRVELSVGDCATPCVGVFDPDRRTALLVFCEQQCKGKNLGLSLAQNSITVQYPAMRSACYMMCKERFEPSWDSGISVTAGEVITSRLQILEFDCPDLSAFFAFYFQNRRILLSDAHAPSQYTKKLWDMMEEHFNRDNFSGEYYAEVSRAKEQCWNPGWCAGGLSSLPLLAFGTELSRQRALQTIDYMTEHMTPYGFFGSCYANGERFDDGFDRPHMKHAMLMRRQGDALCFLFKHFDRVPPKQRWIDSARRCADALVRLYERYESFGQFVNDQTGEMLFGKTTSGAPCISALVRAWQFFGEPRYLDVATRAGEQYYRDFVAQGLTYGGPGEAMCAPDSESAYAMLEAMIELFEETEDEAWLGYARDAAHLLSTWVMSYSYRFPEHSEFGRLGINTVGSVFANVQNKHSAPGLCTASGDALYKLYRHTGDAAYLELLRDIVFFIPQCISTEERPIESWHKDYPKPQTAQVLPSGWICERVNTSDWERLYRVGGVFCGSCWCETSLMLSFAELFFDETIASALLDE